MVIHAVSPEAFAMVILCLHWMEGQFNLAEAPVWEVYTIVCHSCHVMSQFFNNNVMVGWRAQDTEMIEVFAGTANTTRCFRYASYKAVKFDILYKNGKKRQHKSDFMNILDPSGFLLLFSVLENSQITPWSLKTRSLK